MLIVSSFRCAFTIVDVVVNDTHVYNMELKQYDVSVIAAAAAAFR